tara:strand:+ start:1413 stop:2540 length:1128 start_codon:yes stop_codon:yes gene_type:complete
MRRSDFIITSFLKRSNARGTWQVITTFLPIGGLWFLISRIDQASFAVALKIFALLPVLGLLALFSSRAFSLMHDCGHGSLFRSRWLNLCIGFLLGVLNAIPQHPWSRDHAFHHRHNGDWEIYRGPIDVLSLASYQELSERSKLLYAISRHWLMLFPGGFYYLVVKPRLAFIQSIINFTWSISVEILDKLSKKRTSSIFHFSTRLRLNNSGYGNSFWEVNDLIFNNLLVIISWILMSKWLGLGMFLTCYSAVMTLSASIFICIFFVQHNFKGSYSNRTENWSVFMGALEGSSNLDLPDWLNWFFADISFHSMHHLCDRIPNYNLRACHLQNQHLLKNVTVLRLEDIPKCFDYILWNEKLQELTTIEEAERLRSLAV